MNTIRLTFCILMAAFCSGCGTITNHPDVTSVFYPGRVPYGGVKMDYYLGTGRDLGCGPWWFLDMPFSLVFDTLCLPHDLYTTHTYTHELNIYHEFLKQVTQDSASVPSVDWHFCDSKLDKSIRDDSRDYMQQLPSEERKVAHHTYSFEDRSGRHAIEIEIPLNGTQEKHILIYDKDNKRIRTIKYSPGG